MTLTALSGLLGPNVGRAQAASTLDVCGTVTVVVRPTAVTAGAITIGPLAAAIAAGTTVPTGVDVGADLCVRLTLAGDGSITNLVVLAVDATSTLQICGSVTAFTNATATATGLLTIAGRTFTIALGTILPASVRVGSNLCLALDLNALGQIRGATVQANVSATVQICGTISAYAAASLTTSGRLVIAGRAFVLASGSTLPASVRVGADLCLTLQLNGFGQVQDGSASADVTATLRICGTVSGQSAASLTQTGTLVVAGRSFVLALGSSLPASVQAGANLCLALRTNVFGQVQDGTAIVNVTSTLDVCGQVAAFAAATATTDGSLSIGSVVTTVAAGAVLSSQVRAGAYLHLRLTVDAFGRVSDDVVLGAGATLSSVCGNATQPTTSPGPGGTPGPTPSGSGSPAPSGSASPAPSGSSSPSPSGSQAATTGSPSPSTGTCGTAVAGTTSGTAAGGGVDGTSGPLPDTASFARTGGLVLATSIPLAVIAGLLALAWAIADRRRGRGLPTAPGSSVIDEAER